MKLVRVGEQEHVLLVTMHHIVSDGWSMGMVVREFAELYAGYVSGERGGAGGAGGAVWGLCGVAAGVAEGRGAGGADWSTGGSSWRDVEALELPTDRGRPEVHEPAGRADGGLG